jgi:hypothetical protein
MSRSGQPKRMTILRRADSPAAKRSRRQASWRVTENPFRVLGLPVDTSARDVEREGGRILALIAAGLDQPEEPRTTEQVREAIAQLRDPRRRALHEFFALSPRPPAVDPSSITRLLAAIPLELPDVQPLHALLQQLAGELVPLPPPLTLTPGIEQAMSAALLPTPLKAAPVCVDALDLELE